MAARAHDVAALAIKGHSASLNFPHLAHHLPRPASTSPKDIQAAAARAAATTFPSTDGGDNGAEPRAAENTQQHFPTTNVDDDTVFDLPDLSLMDDEYGQISPSPLAGNNAGFQLDEPFLCPELLDDRVTAYWDYQFLFVSQRSEAAEPVALRVVEGAIPSDFPSGTYYLTGPGLFTDDHGSTVHPLDGHGYLRTFGIDGATGNVTFMARYIRTEAQAEERDPETGQWRFTHRGPFSVLKGENMVGNTKVMKNVANTSVLQWGGRLFCLWEGGDPYEIDSGSLDTVGKFQLIAGGHESTSSPSDLENRRKFTADFWTSLLRCLPKRFLSHYKIDARRNRLIIASCNAEDMLLPRSKFYILRVNDGGMWAVSDDISIISESKQANISYLSCYLGFPEVKRIMTEMRVAMLRFKSRLLAVLINGSISRKCFGYDWQSGKLDPAMMNRGEGEDKLLPHLVQVSIRLDRNGDCQNVAVNELNEWGKAADFPAIHPDYSGRKSSCVYAATSSGSRQALPHFPFDTVVKLNTADKSTHTWSAGRRRFIGEPVFVPKGTKHDEDDGYLLVVEYAVATQRCYLVVLDAKQIGKSKAMVARAEVPRHLNFPLGFHGFWAPSK
nr:carotenoid cleavage dioxygenase 7, chloroplastic [Ipomoea batatas]